MQKLKGLFGYQNKNEEESIFITDINNMNDAQQASISINNNNSKRQVVQRLHNMGFADNDIHAAIIECGYHVQQCADWIVNNKQNKTKSPLFVGMELWVFSPNDNDWVPGHIVCIPSTKTIQHSLQTAYGPPDEDNVNTNSFSTQAVSRSTMLLAIIFNGHDFRWLDIDSVEYKIQNEKPAPLMRHNNYDNTEEKEDNMIDDTICEVEHEYVSPRPDETDYCVTFTESVLGLELYSDENGFNCIVGRRVSTFAMQKVTPGSQIVYVNDRCLANCRFEEIRNAVTQSARYPPVVITFRIKKQLDTNKRYDDERTNIAFQNDNDEPQLIDTLSLEQCDKLEIGDLIDYRDDVGRFLLSQIVDKNGYSLKMHYEGWNNKWDTWCNYKSETHRFAAPRSISKKPNTRFRDLKIRDYVDINPIQRHRGWRVAQILRMDRYSGQAQIVYREDGQEFLYWAHLNNREEIAPFMTKAAETIALQQKIAEFEVKQKNNNINNEQNVNMNPLANIQQNEAHRFAAQRLTSQPNTGSEVWLCEFCTFRNMENTTRICEMCQRENKQNGAVDDNDDVREKEILNEFKNLTNDIDQELDTQIESNNNKNGGYELHGLHELVEQQIVDTSGYDIENKSDNDVIINNNNANGPSKQFEKFLTKHRLQKYYKKFEENECCDIRDIEYLIDQEDFIKNDIGIKHPIDRNRFLGEAKKLKQEMDIFQNEYQSVIPSVLLDILRNYGIVTMSILCTEVRNKFDLKNKFNINNDNQINLLWNLIQKQINPSQNPIKNNKQINEEEGLQNNNNEMLNETDYI